jgi:hypothetical protein
LNETETQRFCDGAIRELAARLLRKAKLRTPVGTYPVKSGRKGGTLRRGWTVGKVRRGGGVVTIEIYNPVEYAPYVEFGHRTRDHAGWVDGRFMLTISEQELQRDAPRILQNRLDSFIRGIL